MKNKVNFYSDFNVDLIKKILLAKYKISSNSYNYSPLRIQFPEPKYEDNEICLIWFSLEAFKNTYLQSSKLNKNDKNENLKQMTSHFFDEVLNLSKHFKKIILFSFISFKKIKYNPLKTFEEEGDSFIATKINSFLADKIINQKDSFFVDTQMIINNCSYPYDIKNWYLTKNPFNLDFNKEVSDQINIIIRLISNKRQIKIILLDLDNTIWGGEAGEMDISNIRLGGHDHIGESYADFQRTILSLNKQGILIAIVSKNEENIAMNTFDNHPDMILKRENIIKRRINWEPKYLNIISIMKELNLGLESALFIDDNPIERESIRINLPEVKVLELSKDPCSYSQTLESLDILFTLEITDEDKIRTTSYIQNEERLGMKLSSQNQTSWLHDLGTKVTLNQVNKSNFNRYVQLLNKTNQFNARTRRLTNSEFKDWLSFNCNLAFTIRLEDKFGDLGIIGLLGFNKKNNIMFIEDFVLSCRAAGREIEELMIYLFFEKAKSENLDKIVIKALATKKNKPLIDFFRKNHFLEEEELLTFGINLKNTKIEVPKHINIKYL